MALVKLVYANIASLSAISWQLLKKGFSLKNIFPQSKRFENGLEKKFPNLNIFSLILAENPVFPWFPWLEKSFQKFPWSVGTLRQRPLPPKEHGTRDRDPWKEHGTRQPNRKWHHTETPLPPMDRMTDASKHITLPQTSFAGGNHLTDREHYLQL